jgi:hypothetical protein
LVSTPEDEIVFSEERAYRNYALFAGFPAYRNRPSFRGLPRARPRYEIGPPKMPKAFWANKKKALQSRA